jgi:OOP family OmpA-OmpF porin
MNKQKLFLALSAMLVVTSTQAADTGFYVGGSLGQSSANNFSGSDVDAELLSTYAITASTSTDDSDMGWKLFAGYRFMKYLAVEGAYTDLGKFTATSTVTSPSAGVVNTSLKANTWTLSALGILPLGDGFSLFGRAGVSFWNTDVSATGSGGGGGGVSSASDNGTDWVYGLGAAYNFTDNLSVRGEWESYDFGGGDDADLWSAGISWNF